MLSRRTIVAVALFTLLSTIPVFGQLTLSHSLSTTVTPGNSITCLDNFSPVLAHHETSFWRTYDLPALGVQGPICIEGVEFGVEIATACRKQPVTLRLYVDDDPNPAPVSDMTLVAETTVALDNNTTGALIYAKLAAEIPDGAVVTVELQTPAGQPSLGYFLIGSNQGGESAPGYISAPACSLADPTPLSALGAVGSAMNIVLNLRYSATPCTCLAPTGLVATQLPNSADIELDWTNRAPAQGYDSIEVFVDGVLSASLSGTATHASLTGVAPLGRALPIEVRSSLAGSACTGRAETEVVLLSQPTPLGSFSQLSTPAADLAAGGGTVSDTIVVPGLFPVDGIQVSVDVSHPRMSDLLITLTAPSGNSVTLHSNSFFKGGFGQADLVVTYSDAGVLSCDAPSTCGCLVAPSGPGSLDDVRCGASSGPWTLTVTDVLGQPAGTLNSWQLELSNGICCRAPSDLTATQDCVGGTVTLQWLNNDNYSVVHVTDEYLGSTSSTQLPGTASSFSLSSPSAGLHKITVFGQCSGGPVFSTTVEIEVYQTDGSETDIVLALEGLQGATGPGSIDSGSALFQALQGNGRNPLIVHSPPDDFPCLNHAEVIWVVTGTFPNDYRLSQPEADLLASLNQSGVGIYFESADHWGFQQVPSLLDSRDGILTANNGDDSFTQMDGFDTANGIDLSQLLGVEYTQDYHLSDDNDQLILEPNSASGASHVLWRNHPDSVAETDYITGVFRNNALGGNMISCSWEFGGYGADASTLVAHYLGALIGESPFVRGDCNVDGGADIGDVVFLLSYLFPSSQTASVLCLDACDANDNGTLNIADAVHILWALLLPQSGVTIPPPTTCGNDTTPSALSCLDSFGCP